MRSGRSRSLEGRRIIITRATDQASALATLLSERGAEAIEMPVTRIQPIEDASIDLVLSRLAEYDWLVLTSQNAVRILFDALTARGSDSTVMRGLKLVAVGPATESALRERGMSVSVQPKRFVAEGVLEAMADRGDIQGSRVLYAAALGARDVIPKGLEARGASVDRVDLYSSVPITEGSKAMRARIERRDIDLVTYTAGSAVRAFVDAVGLEMARRVDAASIGPVTSDVARELGLSVVVEAREPTVAGLVDAIEGHYASYGGTANRSGNR